MKHGHSQRSGFSPTYQSWKAMRTRCTNPHSPKYAAYGGRGIQVCARWRFFAGFLANMGERPAGTTLDRIDNDGNYEPGNCRWATQRQQRTNKRCNRIETFRGERKTVVEWAECLGIPHSRLRMRLHRGWSFERAATTPLRGQQ